MVLVEKSEDVLRGKKIFSCGVGLDVVEGGHRRSLAHAGGGVTQDGWHESQPYRKD